MWGVTSFGDELTGDFCVGFEAISIGDFGLFYRLAGKIVSRILGLLQQYRPLSDSCITVFTQTRPLVHVKMLRL
jgi:hypothetical protein